MARIFPEYKRSTVYAMVGALFHIVVLVLPVTITGGKVQFSYYMFLWFDFPLFLLGGVIQEPFPYIYHWMSETSWLCILGTLLYALGGWFIGRSRDKYFQVDQKEKSYS